MSDKDQPRGKVGLAMSGGGYRASLFHLGALLRLNELGWLRKLDVISSVSGGSIVAAFLATRWSELDFDDRDDVARNFEDVFLKPMRTMFGTTIDLQTIAQGLLNPFGSARGRVNGKGLAEGTVGLLGEVAEILGGGMAKKMTTTFTRPWGAVFAAGIDAGAVLWDALNPFPSPSEALIKTYDRLLFHGKTLQDLPDPKLPGNPVFCLYATNLQTGVSVRMTRDSLSDYRLGKVENPDLSLATAVAASSGFPPFYTPVEVQIPLERWSRGRDPTLRERKQLRERMDLGDGAIYDNMGLTMLERNCETILVSDGGDALATLDAFPFDWVSQALRTVLVSMDQSNKVRFGWLIDQFRREKKKGAYWSISRPIKIRLEKENKERELLVDNERTHAIGQMRTRLNRFTAEEQEILINWGYALADANMRRYVIEQDCRGVLPFPGLLE